MPDTPEGRERLARLETQMTSLTGELKETKEELREAKDAIRELTTALTEIRAGLRWSLALGSFLTATAIVLIGGFWVVGTWLYEKFGGGS